jgi:hypothetical protein
MVCCYDWILLLLQLMFLLPLPSPLFILSLAVLFSSRACGARARHGRSRLLPSVRGGEHERGDDRQGVPGPQAQDADLRAL